MSTLPYTTTPITNIDDTASNDMRGWMECVNAKIGGVIVFLGDGDSIPPDSIVIMTNSSPASIVLPVGADGMQVIVKRTDAEVTIEGNIDNTINYTIPIQYEAMRLIYVSGVWWSI